MHVLNNFFTFHSYILNFTYLPFLALLFTLFLSHTYRTPLNSVHMGIKILQKELSIAAEENEDQLEVLTDIAAGCDVAIQILNDLLNYDKLEVCYYDNLD